MPSEALLFAPGIGRRQASPALQLTSQHQHHDPVRGVHCAGAAKRRVALTEHNFVRRAAPSAGKPYPPDFKQAASPRASRALRLVDDAPRSGAYSFEYLESLPKFRRAASSALFHQGFCCRQAKAALHTQTNEVPPLPHELFSSSRTRPRVALSIQNLFPSERVLRILSRERYPQDLPPAGKNHPPDFKQRLSHESLELCSSMTTRRAAACSFEYTDFVPRERGLSAFAPRTLPPAGKSRSSKLKAALSRATLLQFLPASGLSGFAFQIFAQVEFPTSSGIRVFAVRRVKLAKGTNQSSVSPAPRLRRFSKANIKIGNSRFRRPPTADFVREVVQFSDSSFRVPMNLNFNIVRFEA
ncbi:hypothetical protein R3P38DRAFT_3216967 [Favolaschia claudopus]|uniref:Uncharacterized protein n=1 Tax=Favolaschia claudopus TaxID=2862362 RepID=A0AAW0A755_9AGAR